MTDPSFTADQRDQIDTELDQREPPLDWQAYDPTLTPAQAAELAETVNPHAPPTHLCCLTDAKTWVDYWDGKRWYPVAEQLTSRLLQAIQDHEIPIHWRSNRIAEFVLSEKEASLTPRPPSKRVCIGCGVEWKDGEGFVEEHLPLCVNKRYDWLYTTEAPTEHEVSAMRSPIVYCPKCHVELECKGPLHTASLDLGELVLFYRCPLCGIVCRVDLIWLVQNKRVSLDELILDKKEDSDE